MFSDFRFLEKIKIPLLGVFLFFPFLSQAQNQKETLRNNIQKNSVPTKQEALIYGESDASKAAREMANELADIEARSGQLRSRILRFQDLLASRFQDRIEAQFLIRVLEPSPGTGNNALLQPGDPQVTQGELPISVVEMGASLNGIQIVQSDVPQILANTGPVPLFWGPLPVGEYEFKVNVTAGLLMHKLPFGLAQGRWLLEQQSLIKIPFGEKRKLLVEILVSPRGGVPDLQIRWNFVSPERISRREEKP